MSSDPKITAAKARRKAIWEAMGERLYPDNRPLLTLEQFFLHSLDTASLWYNILDVPEPYGTAIGQYDFHRRIRERADVWDVLISITQLDEVPDSEPSAAEPFFDWPNSDHTLIVTTADEAEIRSWLPEGVQPDEIDIDDRSDTPWGSPAFIPKGFHQAWLWYD